MPKQLTEKRLFNIALYYLSRYEASTAKLRAVLVRRIRRMEMRGEEIPAEAPAWIENVIQKVMDYAYVDDARFAENKVRTMIAQGKSERFMYLKLQEAGVDPQVVRRLLEESGSSETERALCFARKKKIGPFRPRNQRADYHQKDMAALARAGFAYDVVLSVLNGDE